MDDNWKPIEGIPKQPTRSQTKFAKKRADHRNAILKDWAERLEPEMSQEFHWIIFVLLIKINVFIV